MCDEMTKTENVSASRKRCTLDASLHAGEDLVCNLYSFDGLRAL